MTKDLGMYDDVRNRPETLAEIITDYCTFKGQISKRIEAVERATFGAVPRQYAHDEDICR